MTGHEIEFEILSDGAGKRKAAIKEGKIEYEGALYDELYFEAPNPSTAFAQESFMLVGVTIGKQFHWQRQENQVFAGALKIIVDRDNLVAINVIGVEDYLLSVISSEMSANCSLELLKAHAVISRSWVMARMEQGREDAASEQPVMDKEADVVEYVKWYDHQEHKLFDVCADDHCQRYQGLTRATGENVRKAVDATWGQILTYGGRLCDARFSKCCGGVMEKFSTCWEDKDYPYLQPLPDTADHKHGGRIFCDTADPAVISQILNGYDRQTQDFMSWEAEWSREDVSRMVAGKSGVDLGMIQQFIPLERGESGRIYKLEIKGDKRTLIVGKELEIRRLLSDSHLKSSAFDIEYILDGKPSDASSWDHVILKGRGWGHGVGLCQIGAAVMASEGYAYTQILSHYYPSSQLTIINE